MDKDVEGTGEGTAEGAPEASQDELVAREGGWLPKEDWVAAGKDPGKWKTPELFNEFGSLEKRIGQMDRAIGRYKKQSEEDAKAVKKLVEHTVKAVKLEREKTLRELKAQKAQALRNDEHEAVVEIDEAIAQVKEQAKEDAADAVAQGKDATDAAQKGSPVVAAWLANPENNWYKNEELRSVADEEFDYRIYKGDTVEQALAKVEAKVKREFPQSFKKAGSKGKTTEGGDDNRTGATKQNGVKGKYSIKSVDEMTRKFAKEMSASNPKAYPTPQAYIDAMAEDGYFNKE